MIDPITPADDVHQTDRQIATSTERDAKTSRPVPPPPPPPLNETMTHGVIPPRHILAPLGNGEISSTLSGLCFLTFIVLVIFAIIAANHNLCGVRWMKPPSDMTPIETKIRDGYVENGWTPAAWATRLRTLADTCESIHPDAAADLRHWAESVERKHPKPIFEPPIEIPDEPIETPPAKPAIVRY